MARDDILDPARARFYLWGAGGAADKQESVADANSAAKSSDKAEKSSEGPELQPAEFAVMVQRVWAMSDPGLQARATIGLAEHAEKLSLRLAAMPPYEAVQLLRLIVRHRLFIEPDLYKQLPSALMWLSLEAPELVDLLVEVAETGDTALEFLMSFGMGHTPSALPGLGLRLLPILRAERHFQERELAAGFADWAQDWAELVPELRRALKAPYLRLRVVALQGLLAKGGLQAEDVQALLEDLVVHPPLDHSAAQSQACFDYGRTLHEAIVKLRPPEGYRSLLAIVHHECAFVRGWRRLDDSFALIALAAAYPEHALEEIDRKLESTSLLDRRQAVAAAAELVDELARPRLFQGTGDPDAYVHEYAHEIWLKRFRETPCLEPELAIELELGVASQSLGPRLTVLRSNNKVARLTMVKALLAAAPEREALALLLYALRDHNLWICVRELGLPQSCAAWAQALCTGFGEPAFDGLMALAERQTTAGVQNGWLGALAALPKLGLLGEPQLDALRSLAERVLMSAMPGNCCSDAIVALRAVGVPDSCFDRLWTIALQSATKGSAGSYNGHYAAYVATDALGQAVPHPELDARVVSEFSASIERRDFESAEGLIGIGLLRQNAVELLALTERALELCAGELALRSNTAALKLATRCVEFLQARDALAGRLLSWLGQPEHPLFTAALNQVKMGCDWAVPALVAALESTAGSGAVAARAAERLLSLEAIDVRDERLDAVLAHAPLRDGVELAASMLYFSADIGRVSRTIIEAICSCDEDIAEPAVNALAGNRERQNIWREALQRGVHASIKEYALKQAGMRSEVEQYWQDENEEEESPQDEEAQADP